jgi:5-methylcytosine-specific restriction protein A
MPRRAGRPCNWPGCGEVVSARFCPLHEVNHRLTYEASRGTSTQRGYGSEHRAWRAAVLTRDQVCQDPEGHHPTVRRPATVADHIVPVARGGTWTLENGQALCAECHSAKTARMDGGFGNAVRPRAAGRL